MAATDIKIILYEMGFDIQSNSWEPPSEILYQILITHIIMKTFFSNTSWFQSGFWRRLVMYLEIFSLDVYLAKGNQGHIITHILNTYNGL